MKIIHKTCLITVSFIMIFACKEHYMPKPRGYLRINLPEKKYILFDTNCPFTFEYPVYGTIIPDKSKNTEPCWYNIYFKDYNGTIYFSFKPIQQNLPSLIEDSRTFAYKHTIKADAIQEKVFRYPEKKVSGVIYDIKGNVASSVQFFITDSTRYFLRGALYFETRPNKDSLLPVIDFFKEDIFHLINTIKWK